jgi:hypothetical protein
VLAGDLHGKLACSDVKKTAASARYAEQRERNAEVSAAAGVAPEVLVPIASMPMPPPPSPPPVQWEP